MRNVCFQIVRSWGTKSRLNIAEYLWILSMFGVLAGLEDSRIGLFLIPPFGATLTILIDSSRGPGRATLRCCSRLCCRSFCRNVAQPIFARIPHGHFCRSLGLLRH
jgi:hypothetical protein